SRDLDRERKAWLADADALEATAEGAVVETEAAREAIDPELDPETWHRTRAPLSQAPDALSAFFARRCASTFISLGTQLMRMLANCAAISRATSCNSLRCVCRTAEAPLI
ncbi:MAG: hypothetical protein ABJA34_13620, partial [Pseudonocardiales bacterium]